MYDEVMDELDRNQAERAILLAMKSMLTIDDSMDDLNKEILRLKDEFEIPDGGFGNLLSIVERIASESASLYVGVYSTNQEGCGAHVWLKAMKLVESSRKRWM